MIKLNVGPSPIWDKDGWYTLDHKTRDESVTSLQGDAANIPLNNDTCSTVFTSHMFEHIPHVKLEKILLEFNRVLSQDGVLRILTPDLKKIARAYVSEDQNFFDKAKLEDENIRTDLGFGGMFMNFIVSPGQDTALYDRGLSEFIAGYAHLYSYDFKMLKILLERTGFHCVEQKQFCESEIEDYQEPLHVEGMDPTWQNFNQNFYKENDLIHYYDSVEGKYIINFKVTGFDRDPLTSLIIEARKNVTVDLENYESLNDSKQNYNKYAWSLLKDEEFVKKNDAMLKAIRSIKNRKV
ncbi:methyltransferase domain-containing protein [Alphaproteobacteria bacterium]|nr:class I SAM-dependent methyltransferase [Alphaproteobacteria bacterium]MDC1023080.1 methyltransferase domain-containing protein [Alphaproteobacteria bacterium]